MAEKWWKRHRGRLKFELKALAKLGASFKVDRNLFERGVVVLKGRFPIGSEMIYLEIVYPDHYPYFRFMAVAPELNLRYHQQLFQKNLCLLTASAQEWHYEDTAAAVLSSQLAQIRIANQLASKEEVLAHETLCGYKLESRDPEPVERYMDFTPGTYIIIDSKWKLAGPNGALVVGFMASDKHSVLAGAVIEVKDRNNKILYTAAPSIAKLYPHKVKGRWQHTDKPIVSNEPQQYIEQLAKENPAILTTIPQPARNIKTDVPGEIDLKIDVVASVYEDETSHRDSDGTLSWIFIARWIFRQERAIKSGKKITTIKTQPFFIKGERAGKDDMSSRVPELRGLAEKKIALFGLGCIGSPCAIEFAKAGIGELRILDCDTVSAGNGVRWIIGLSAVGKRKTIAVMELLNKNYPYTKVIGYDARIGDQSLYGKEQVSLTLNDIVEQMLNEADVIVDATADEGVQNFLADMARERGSLIYLFQQQTVRGEEWSRGLDMENRTAVVTVYGTL